MKTTVVSLCSGAGGLDCGLEMAGAETKVFVEADPACRQTLALNFPGATIFDDLNTVKPEQILTACPGGVDIMSAGLPCQSFSVGGKRKGVEDPRGRLMYSFLNLVSGVLPRAIIFENVIGIFTSMVNPNTSVIDFIKSKLQEMGYFVRAEKIDASKYGVPQKRRRVILLASQKAVPRFPPPIDKVKTLGEAIADLELMPGECARFSEKTEYFMQQVPEGGHWRSLPTHLQQVAMGNVDITKPGSTAFYRRLSYDKPAPTLLTCPYQKKTLLCHPRQTRPLSVEEYRRIQTFPNHWKFFGNRTQKYRQLGNAVPVQLAYEIGKTVIADLQ